MPSWGDDRERTYELARGDEVIATGTLDFVVRTGGHWSAMFSTSTAGLGGSYELRLPRGERATVLLRDLNEAAAAPSHLHGEVPYGNLRLHTYAVNGDGEPLII